MLISALRRLKLLRLIQGHSHFKDAVLDFPQFCRGCWPTLLSLAAGVGALLCIVPYVIIGVGLAFSLYIVVDQEKSAIDALKAALGSTMAQDECLYLYIVVQ